ncbi:hypothetical protein J1N35_043975 [Gossypium stocksii]|uniref:Reverse transcriptase domain-containing protein n=1 Tax=Gossypium stocksii TaxID=47602 RepID=A0A9D3U8M7_9ROSI|nr:hypothetical protein J1N35_043975 [Gossypium stocksii]
METFKTVEAGERISMDGSGDFNGILYSFEKKDDLLHEEGRMEAFRKVLEDFNLVDLGSSRNWFTWERGNLPETNIKERLDRSVANDEWVSRRKRNFIQKLNFEDVREIESMEEMVEIARSYFQQLFSAGRRGDYDHVLRRINRCVLKEDNLKLKASYKKEELCEALQEMGPTKAPGEDGFPTLFYQKC